MEGRSVDSLALRSDAMRSRLVTHAAWLAVTMLIALLLACAPACVGQ